MAGREGGRKRKRGESLSESRDDENLRKNKAMPLRYGKFKNKGWTFRNGGGGASGTKKEGRGGHFHWKKLIITK